MPKFRKRPVVITAECATERTEIETVEGTMVADVGDMIITGVMGERYPCKPEIFEATYDPVTEDDGDELKTWGELMDGYAVDWQPRAHERVIVELVNRVCAETGEGAPDVYNRVVTDVREAAAFHAVNVI